MCVSIFVKFYDKKEVELFTLAMSLNLKVLLRNRVQLERHRRRRERRLLKVRGLETEIDFCLSKIRTWKVYYNVFWNL